MPLVLFIFINIESLNPPIVGALAEAAKAKMAVALNHCDAAKIFVYPPETTPPFSEQNSIRGDKILKELIDELGNKNPRVSIGYDHPLIVVAPQPQQDGENIFGFFSFVYC